MDTVKLVYGEIIQLKIRPSFDSHQLVSHSSSSSSLSTARLIRLLLPVFRHPIPLSDPGRSFPAPSSIQLKLKATMPVTRSGKGSAKAVVDLKARPKKPKKKVSHSQDMGPIS